MDFDDHLDFNLAGFPNIINKYQMNSFESSRLKYQKNNSKLLMSSASSKFIALETDIKEQNLQTTPIAIFPDSLQSELKMYDWRIKTEFPIVKVYDYKIIQTGNEKILMEVRCQFYPIRLADVKDIPLFKMLYLLKESIIGFQRLYDKFGSFALTPKMVALSQVNKCKIWFNQNFASNVFISSQIEEKTFLSTIFDMFQTRSNKMKNTVSFFQDLRACRTFCNSLSFIQNYARENKINIPTYCKLAEKQFSTLQNSSTSNFNASLTMSRSQRCFNNTSLRVSLKPNAKDKFIKIDSSTSIHEQDEQQSNTAPKINDNFNMKTSGDTAVDMQASNTMSFSNKDGKVDQSFLFGNNQWKGFKNQMPLKMLTDKKLLITRKFSGNEKELHLFTPKYKKKQKQLEQEIENWSGYQVKINGQIYKGEKKDNEQEPQVNVTDVFNKNNWEKTLGGLFETETGMKKSFHQGKQKRNTQKCSIKLNLLGNFGKNIHQSFIHDDHNHPSTSQL